MFHHRYHVFIMASLSAVLSACACMPTSLQGDYSTVSPVTAQQGGFGGTRVRWGGQIIKTRPGSKDTCFYILAHSLNAKGRPHMDRKSQGRFVACHPGFYDPQVFAHGRELTITGTVQGIISRKVGGYAYAYPRVEANVIYLWPRHSRVLKIRYWQGFYPPFTGNWEPWSPWSYGYYPYFPNPSMIVIPLQQKTPQTRINR